VPAQLYQLYKRHPLPCCTHRAHHTGHYSSRPHKEVRYW